MVTLPFRSDFNLAMEKESAIYVPDAVPSTSYKRHAASSGYKPSPIKKVIFLQAVQNLRLVPLLPIGALHLRVVSGWGEGGRTIDSCIQKLC